MSISPDFRHLAVAFIRDGVPNLWTTQLGERGPGGPFVQRTSESVSGAFGSWSDDGSWLAYQCGRGGDTQICLIDGDGTQPVRQLTHDPGTNFIGEWLDDDAVLFAAKHAGRLERAQRLARHRDGVDAHRVRRAALLRALSALGSGRPAGGVRALRDDGPPFAVQLPAVIAAQSPRHGSGR